MTNDYALAPDLTGAGREFTRSTSGCLKQKGMNMKSVGEPEAAWLAAVDARARSRQAHHEAGHAVAAVARGGRLIRVSLGTVDWSTEDESADTPGETEHRTAYADQPFVTFAGPLAQAIWMLEHDDGVDDLYEALECALFDSSDGDTAKYWSRVDELCVRFGSNPVERAWEADWYEELEPLMPAVREVAEMLLDGQSVTHDDVQAAVDRCRKA